ncbi:MAG: hypothetical protein HY674_18975 [Chloroflexi bacterium]|nr:hypothetical protein [Chloroflexota bacterium]
MTATFALKSPQSIPPFTLAFFALRCFAERIIEPMTKTVDIIAEVIQNTKHPFRQVADRPDKPHKNRYERRKVKQYIQLGDWASENKS